MDSVTDTLANGQRFPALTILNTVSRGSPAIEVDASLPGQRVVTVVDRLIRTSDIPKRIGVAKGPELISTVLNT